MPATDRRIAGTLTVTLVFHVGLLAYSAAVHSPVVSEVGHFSAGVSHWEFGRFDLYRVNPPLVRMVATIPAVVAGVNRDWAQYETNPHLRREREVGADFLRVNRKESRPIIIAGRWACIPFSVLGALVCYFWSLELFGNPAGLIAASLWCFSPSILGHASLITPDAHAAAMAVAAAYTFWRWLCLPSIQRATWAGIVLGLAELTKTTLVVFYPVFVAIWLVMVLRSVDRSHKFSSQWLGLAWLVVVSVIVINAGYLGEGSFQKVGDYQFQSQLLAGSHSAVNEERSGNRFSVSLFAQCPVPLPKNYVQGIDTQRIDFERTLRSYLGGEWRNGGWWYFYLYAFCVKTPIGTLLLLLLAITVLMLDSRYSSSLSNELSITLPPFAVVLLVSSQTGFSIHPRYAILVLPFLFIWISRIGQALHFQKPLLTYATLFGLVLSATSSLFIYPHSLSFFNVCVGGPKEGHRYLVDSAMGWGQDLYYLEDWLEQHSEATSIHLASFGFLDPALLGIKYQPIPIRPPHSQIDLARLQTNIAPGWYAIDVNHLVGTAEPLPGVSLSDSRLSNSPSLTCFKDLTPAATIGYSMRIYQVTAPESSVTTRVDKFGTKSHFTPGDENRIPFGTGLYRPIRPSSADSLLSDFESPFSLTKTGNDGSTTILPFLVQLDWGKCANCARMATPLLGDGSLFLKAKVSNPYWIGLMGRREFYLSDECSKTSLSLLNELCVEEEGAWEDLVAIYAPRVYNRCRHSGLSVDDSEDVVQNVFTAVSRSIQRFEHDGDSACFRKWLNVVTSNKLRDYWRKNITVAKSPGGSDWKQFIHSIEEEVDDSSMGSMLVGSSSESTNLDIIHQIRAETSGRDWSIFEDLIIDEKPVAELAKNHGVSANVIYLIRSRLLKRMRELAISSPT